MEENDLALDSSPSQAQKHDDLPYENALPLDPELPPGPAARGEKIWASPSLAPSTGPEGI